MDCASLKSSREYLFELSGSYSDAEALRTAWQDVEGCGGVTVGSPEALWSSQVAHGLREERNREQFSERRAEKERTVSHGLVRLLREAELGTFSHCRRMRQK